jgi:uncharacterized damage-inducible protein DinB
MDNALLDLLRHKNWATLKLIEFCQQLGQDDLEATIPGTYGTLIATLNHAVHSDADYLRMVEGAPEPTFPNESLQQLLDRMRGLGPRWEAAAAVGDLHDREITLEDGYRMRGSVPIAQSIHHADDHRTQVLSILGARGHAVPDLDVWAWAEVENLVQAPTEEKFG